MRFFKVFPDPFPQLFKLFVREALIDHFSPPPPFSSSSSNRKGLNPAEKEVCVRRSPVLVWGRDFNLRCIVFERFRVVLDISHVGQCAALALPS